MTSERPRFPLGLTLAAIVVIAICSALGVWQLGRAAWKARELARIAALKTAPPQPIGPVLAKAAAGGDASFNRVRVVCGAAAPGGGDSAYMMSAADSQWVARPLALCRLTNAGPYDSIALDRGVVDSSRGATTPPSYLMPPPQRVVGVLFPNGATKLLPDTGRTAPYVLSVESETPAPPGVTPTPYPDAASNLEYVGTYAPTWFGLAAVALCFYAAMLWRRYHPKR